MSLTTIDKTTTQKTPRKYKGTKAKIYQLMIQGNNDFDTAPASWFNFSSEGELESITANLFDVLNEYLEYDPILQRDYDKFDRKTESSFSMGYLQTMEEYAAKTDSEYTSDNSYNWDSPLNGIIQFVKAKDALDNTYWLIQYHTGGDARCNYTKPIAFRSNDDDCFQSALVSTHAGCDCGLIDIWEGSVQIDEWDQDKAAKSEYGYPKAWVPHKDHSHKAFCVHCKQTVSADISRY